MMDVFFKMKKIIFFSFFLTCQCVYSITETNFAIPIHLFSNYKHKTNNNSTFLQQEIGNISFSQKKTWTIIIYMAADNDLARFALKNLLQLAEIGSNNHLNIVVHLDITLSQKKKVTFRYYVTKNKLTILNHDDQKTQKMDSGDPKTLIDCCRWAIENFPADNYLLDLWNHGLGCLDFVGVRTINTFNLFTLNTESNLLDLDRTIPFLKLIEMHQLNSQRGICFDDTTGNFLTNHDLAYALSTIQKNYLRNKKFAVITFDACLMSMIEIGNIIKPFADIMIGSQEVVLGAGYDYRKVAASAAQSSITPHALAKLIVDGYKTTYENITHDFTHSAINLRFMDDLEQSVNHIAELLITGLREQRKSSVKQALKKCRHKLLCTHFDEPSYIDLGHFLCNVSKEIQNFQLASQKKERKLKEELKKTIDAGLAILRKSIIANVCGKNLKNAQGISIYFPEKHIYPSYHNTDFAKSNRWFAFLHNYATSV